MQALELKLPPPLVMLICLAMMWGASHLIPPCPLNLFIGNLIACLLVISGMFFSTGGVLNFKRANTTVNPLEPQQTSSLVTSGVYRFTRNPMYLGLVCLLLAWGLYLNSVWALICVPIFMLYIQRFQIMPEERALKALFGAEFEHYQRKVRRWL